MCSFIASSGVHTYSTQKLHYSEIQKNTLTFVYIIRTFADMTVYITPKHIARPMSRRRRRHVCVSKWTHSGARTSFCVHSRVHLANVRCVFLLRERTSCIVHFYWRGGQKFRHHVVVPHPTALLEAIMKSNKKRHITHISRYNARH